MARVFIGIGTNLGDRRKNIRLAKKSLDELPDTRLVAFSGVYETAPEGPEGQGRYLNAAAEIETELAALHLLDALANIEKQTGRPPADDRQKWGPRTLDLDILLYERQIISSDRLVVPHPLMHDRWFVLKPLADLDPNIVHPLLEMTVGELLNYLESPMDDIE